ncbi:MAG: hypothetical protein ABJ275_00355 [Maricaulaceae bacterium]
MSYIPNAHNSNNVSDELSIRYLKKRLKRLNRLIRTSDAAPADYINRDRVAFQLQDALSSRRSLLIHLSSPVMMA